MGLFDFLKKAIQGEQEEEEPQLNEFSVVIKTTDQPRDTDPTRYAGSEFLGYDSQLGVPVFRRRQKD